MDFIREFLEANWQMFLRYLKSMGIPESECEAYAEKLIKQLEKEG